MTNEILRQSRRHYDLGDAFLTSLLSRARSKLGAGASPPPRQRLRLRWDGTGKEGERERAWGSQREEPGQEPGPDRATWTGGKRPPAGVAPGDRAPAKARIPHGGQGQEPVSELTRESLWVPNIESDRAVGGLPQNLVAGGGRPPPAPSLPLPPLGAIWAAVA